MSTSSVSSALSGSSSLAQQLLQLKTSSTSTLLSSLDTSSSPASLTKTVCSGTSDVSTISAISKSLNSTASAAEESGVSEAMDNVRLFTSAMISDGVDNISILQYLGNAGDLAETDSDSFLEIFSTAGTDSTDDTIESISESS